MRKRNQGHGIGQPDVASAQMNAIGATADAVRAYAPRPPGGKRAVTNLPMPGSGGLASALANGGSVAGRPAPGVHVSPTSTAQNPSYTYGGPVRPEQPHSGPGATSYRGPDTKLLPLAPNPYPAGGHAPRHPAADSSIQGDTLGIQGFAGTTNHGHGMSNCRY
jgi:hypothetical protein